MPPNHRPLPPLDLLVGFEAAARHASFTKAAGELFLTQSAVSRQIQALEEFLGVGLFERRHKALALTDAGTTYYRTVAATLDQLREATRRIRDDAQPGHRVTVTTTVSFASLWLIPRLARFRKLAPGVDVRLKATSEVVDLEREGIDLAVRDCAADRAPPDAELLAGEHLAAVASPGYVKESRAARRPLAHPQDLRHHVILEMHDPKGLWPWLTWAGWLEAIGIDELTPAASQAFDQYDQVIQAALHGHGIALGRLTTVRHYIQEKRLVALFGREQRLARAMYVVKSKRGGDRESVTRFVEWMKAEVAGK